MEVINLKKKFKSQEIFIDIRSKSVDLDEHSKFKEEYANRKLDYDAFLESWKVVKNLVDSNINDLSEEDKKAHKIILDDYWIRYKDLRNKELPCPGEPQAIEYINEYDKLHPDCEKCRKVLLFDIDDKCVSVITKEFLVNHFNFNFKIGRDLGVLVAYANGDKSKEEIINFLEKFLAKFELKGRIQWRLAGKYLQFAAPRLFKSAKMLSYN